MMTIDMEQTDILADSFGANASWPTAILDAAEALAANVPNFNKERFIARAQKVWEENYKPEEIDDEILF